MDLTLVTAMLSPTEPPQPSPIIYALRTSMRLQAAAQGITFAQAQANFKAMWNSIYTNYPIP